MKHYFAYGANMDLDKMFDRCPHAKFIEAGELMDVSLVFKIFENS
jgi:hypothetical protein